MALQGLDYRPTADENNKGFEQEVAVESPRTND